MRTDKNRNVITRASILATIGKTEENVKEGLSIEDVLQVFQKHRLQLKVYDKFYKMVFNYDPPKISHHNKVMYCLMTDGHVYTLNHDLPRLAQLDEDDEGIKPTVNDSYYIKEDSEARKAKMINNIDDIIQVIRDMGPSEDKDQKRSLTMIHRDDDLLMLLNQLTEAGYSPGISFEAGRVSALMLELNNIRCTIQIPQLIKSAIDGVVVVDDEQTYNNMNEAMNAMKTKLFLKNHLSYYTEADLQIMDSYRTKPICGMLGAKQDNLIEIDVSKAYTSAFNDITKIPIFNEFDAFKPYEGEEIEPLNLYMVKDFEHPLITQSHMLVFGKYLREGMNKVAVKKPSFIKEVDYAKLVEELYETKISDNEQHDIYIKNLIANVNIGLLEKCYNKKSVGYLYKDYDECKHYQAQFGGSIHNIQQIADISTVAATSTLGLDDGVDEVMPTIVTKFAEVGQPFYVLALKAERQLRNGFRFIKELLLQAHNAKLMQADDRLAEADVRMVSVKTDCFTIRAEDEAKARELLTFDQGIGTWRVSKTKDIIFPFETLSMTQLDDIVVEHLKTNDLVVNDEWKTDEMLDHFERERRVMVRAEYAGCGKSFACKAMEKRGHKVLFVCPTNKLAQNNKDSGVTLNTFFGVGMSDDATQKMAKFDDSIYDVIVFDEIYFANIRMLTKIKRYCENNPSKIILATGDTNQLETIDLVSNTTNYEEYMELCLDTMFPNRIMLRENKRLRTKKDKDTLKQFKQDIFDESKPVSETIKKYFKFTNEVKTTNNIAFRNSTCEDVAKTVRKMLKKTAEFEVGEIMVCRKYLKMKGLKCNVNFEYKVKTVYRDVIRLEELNGNNTFDLKRDVVQKHFIHSYCRTCHSFQGSSIDDKITIFDWRFFFVSRKWLYTSVTRATELKNVVFFSGKCDDHDDEILDKYLTRKVDNYRKQDIQHKRALVGEFITPEWLKSQFGKVCHDCGDCLRFDIVDGKVESNLSADRVDNDECHHLNNIVPLCVSCNQRKSCW